MDEEEEKEEEEKRWRWRWVAGGEDDEVEERNRAYEMLLRAARLA